MSVSSVPLLLNIKELIFVCPLYHIAGDNNVETNMRIEDFEKELQLIDKDLSIRPNNPPPKVVEMFPDVAKLASILYRGSELCTIPNFDIYDEPNGTYGVDLRQDGRFIRHRTRPEALQMVKDKLALLANDKEYADQFFGTGEYSEAALRRIDEKPGDQTVIDEVSADAGEVTDNMIEGPK